MAESWNSIIRNGKEVDPKTARVIMKDLRNIYGKGFKSRPSDSWKQFFIPSNPLND